MIFQQINEQNQKNRTQKFQTQHKLYGIFRIYLIFLFFAGFPPTDNLYEDVHVIYCYFQKKIFWRIHNMSKIVSGHLNYYNNWKRYWNLSLFACCQLTVLKRISLTIQKKFSSSCWIYIQRSVTISKSFFTSCYNRLKSGICGADGVEFIWFLHAKSFLLTKINKISVSVEWYRQLGIFHMAGVTIIGVGPQNFLVINIFKVNQAKNKKPHPNR